MSRSDEFYGVDKYTFQSQYVFLNKSYRNYLALISISKKPSLNPTRTGKVSFFAHKNDLREVMRLTTPDAYTATTESVSDRKLLDLLEELLLESLEKEPPHLCADCTQSL